MRGRTWWPWASASRRRQPSRCRRFIRRTQRSTPSTRTLFAGPLRLDGGDKRARNAVVVSPGRLDRSPCGTGTCARLAVMHARGQIGEGRAIRPRIGAGHGVHWHRCLVRRVSAICRRSDPRSPAMAGSRHSTSMCSTRPIPSRTDSGSATPGQRATRTRCLNGTTCLDCRARAPPAGRSAGSVLVVDRMAGLDHPHMVGHGYDRDGLACDHVRSSGDQHETSRLGL